MSERPPPTHQPPLDYASDDRRADDAPRRSFGKWMILLVCWLAGLGVWAVYIAAIIYLFFHYLA